MVGRIIDSIDLQGRAMQVAVGNRGNSRGGSGRSGGLLSTNMCMLGDCGAGAQDTRTQKKNAQKAGGRSYDRRHGGNG